MEGNRHTSTYVYTCMIVDEPVLTEEEVFVFDEDEGVWLAAAEAEDILAGVGGTG